MKRFLLLIIGVLVLCSATFAQAKKMRLTVNLQNALLTGKVEVKGNHLKEEIVVGEDKMGMMEIALEQGEYVSLTIGYARNLLYLEPGKDLTLVLVPNKDGSFHLKKNSFNYQGDVENVRINKYLNENDLKFLERIDFTLGENEFLKKLSELNKENTELIKKQKFAKEFEKIELFRVKYQLYTPLVSYPIQHFWKNGSEWTGLEQYEETPQVKAYIPKLFIDNEQVWKISSYRDYVKGGIGILGVSEFMGNDRHKGTLEQLNFLTEHFKTPVILEDITQSLVMQYIEVTEGRPLRDIESFYKRNVKKEVYQQELAQAQKMWAKYSEGTQIMSSDHKYMDIDGKMVALEDLRGKYVYIDVWATWCGPCKAELPYLKKLEKKFKGKNIYFVSISIDANKAAWIKMVQEDQLGGIQLHGGNKAQIAKDYAIRAIPRFILLDREGKVINKEMTRPSDSETEETLNALEGI